jgi:hypothetical protein
VLSSQRRLEARGVELQADMHSVRHRIDDPAGWEAFSLYSQQQADLEGRLRLVGSRTQPGPWRTFPARCRKRS